ncbi:MAG: vitamin K epoxide reductase family protein [Muribaculaceae bacterium]|nr:vitamin K epoxide reductase family protein [Muribaculaceae bacterium]
MKSTSRLNPEGLSRKPSLLGDWLTLLGVGHTTDYTIKREKDIPFKTWFGFSRALHDYGVESIAYNLSDRDEIDKVPVPFIAHTAGEEGGNIIVTSIKGDQVEYLSLGENKTTSMERFMNAWDGNVFLSRATAGAAEPELGLHRRLEFFTRSKRWVLISCLILLLVYAFIANGLYKFVSTYFITAIDLGGLYVTYLLVQKSLKIHNPKADRFCGVLQAGGCDDILATSASKFFGLFGWSEVGFAYFSVSLLALLMFPGSLPWLALCNVCCLPFTAWSIWYQRFRAHRWCTLCVTVQCSLWLLFIAYLSGGWLGLSFPVSIDFFVLGICYIGVMLLINALMPLIEKQDK